MQGRRVVTTLKSLPFLLFIGMILTTVSGCPVQTPARSGEKPDPLKITVFYPLGDKVRGRGGPGAVKPGTKFVYIAPHPSAGTSIVRADPDGSFEFAVLAGSNDILEFAYSDDNEGLVRGPSIYLAAPQARIFESDQYCCKTAGSSANSLGKCVSVDEEKPNCKDHTPLNECLIDANCAKFSNRNVNFPVGGLEVNSPDESGVVRIQNLPNQFPALTIVSVENRGQQGIGGPVLSGRKQYDITDEEGNFELSITAAGDDELVFEIYQLDYQRSRQHSEIVPDADFAGVDIVGAFPGYDYLVPNKTGRVAIRFAPFGIDGRGICPSPKSRPPADPVLCFTGGLEHSMVTINEITLEGQSVQSSSTSPSVELPFTRATAGDIMAGKQTIGLLLDVSIASFANDPEGIRFQAAKNIINTLRNRDRLLLYSTGRTDAGYQLEAQTGDNRAAVLQKIDELQTMRPSEEFPNDIFGGIQAAVTGITSEGNRGGKGMLLVINTQSPDGGRDEYLNALRSVAPNDAQDYPGVKTLIIGLDLETQDNGDLLKDLAIYSLGSFTNVTEPRNLLLEASDVASEIAGAFILLYDVEIPGNVGKASSIKINATVSFPGGTDKEIQSQAASFEGTLEISGAP